MQGDNSPEPKKQVDASTKEEEFTLLDANPLAVDEPLAVGVAGDRTLPTMRDSGEIMKPRQEKSLVGEVIDNQFKLTEVLGRGGMSSVYKALNLVLNKVVAIKLMHPHLVSDSNALMRFKQEAQAASHIDHPNVIQVYSFGITSGENAQPFIVMDFIEGESLSERIRRDGRLPVADVLKIFIQVCNALAHAHDKGIVHRDLKPSNIMIVEKDGDSNFVKIVDFGIAKLLPQEGEQAHRLTQTGDVFGSPLYMSPEQCMGRPVDKRSDVYALGCVIYECLTGLPPHNSTNVFETFHKHIAEIPEPMQIPGADKAIIDRLDAVVFRALEKEPEKRYQSMSALENDLRSIAKVMEGGSGGTDIRIELARQQRSVLRMVQNAPKKAFIAGATSMLIVVAGAFVLAKSAWFIQPHKFETQSTYWLRFLPSMFGKIPMDANQKEHEISNINLSMNLIAVKHSEKSEELLNGYLDKAVRCAKIDEPDVAIESFQSAIATMLRRAPNPEDAKNDPKYLEAAEGLADCLLLQGDVNRAQPFLEDVEFLRDLKSSTYSNWRVPRTYLELGYAYFKKGDYRHALIQLNDGIGLLNKKHSDSEETLSSGKETRKEETSNSRMLAILYAVLGEVYKAQSKWNEAENSFEQANKVIASSDYSRADAFESELALQLAFIKLQQEQYKEACSFYQKSMPYVQENFKGQLANLQHVLDAYAYACWKSGDFSKALELHDESEMLGLEGTTGKK